MSSQALQSASVPAVTVRACAKINLTLRVIGVRADGYHDLRTIFQSLALHDTLVLSRVRGPFRIVCDDPACPTDRTNLVWRAAEIVWRAAGHHGAPRDVVARLTKRIPLQSGLGGGSSDAAAAIRGLSRLWRVRLSLDARDAAAAALGADVPFFLTGGTALGLDRGDLLFPLTSGPRLWVTLAMPPFGVSTKDAFAWWDAAEGRLRDSDPAAAPRRTAARSARLTSAVSLQAGLKRSGAGVPGIPAAELRNDLEPVVGAHHPEIAGLVRRLVRHGAEYAAMSGSGSTIFGLFASRADAVAAANSLSAGRVRALVTRTVAHAQYARISAPE